MQALRPPPLRGAGKWRHNSIDMDHRFGYMYAARPGRDVTGDGQLTGWVRCLRAGLVTPFPGGSGHRPAGINDRSARSSLDWDRQDGVTPHGAEPRKRGWS